MASEREASLADAHASLASSSLPGSRMPIDLSLRPRSAGPSAFVQQMSYFLPRHLFNKTAGRAGAGTFRPAPTPSYPSQEIDTPLPAALWRAFLPQPLFW